MNMNFWKKVVVGVITTTVVLSMVLGVHIYLVTRHKPSANTLVMARIDFKQTINGADSAKITNWLLQQKGVNHVLCNPANSITVFTFFPLKNNANEIVNQLVGTYHYKAVRFLPTKAEMMKGCPVASL